MSGFTINTVSVSGNLTRDPELRTTPSGMSICKLRIAVNDRVKDRDTGEWSDRPNYFDVTIFKGIGESVSRQLSKGDVIVVQGRLRWEEWKTNEGQKRSAVSIVADSVVPVPRDGGGQRSSGGSNSSQDLPIDTGDFESAPLPGSGGMPGDDDIPFLWQPAEWDDR